MIGKCLYFDASRALHRLSFEFSIVEAGNGQGDIGLPFGNGIVFVFGLLDEVAYGYERVPLRVMEDQIKGRAIVERIDTGIPTRPGAHIEIPGAGFDDHLIARVFKCERVLASL